MRMKLNHRIVNIVAILTLTAAWDAHALFRVQRQVERSRVRILSSSYIPGPHRGQPKVLRSIPMYFGEGMPPQGGKFVETVYSDEQFRRIHGQSAVRKAKDEYAKRKKGAPESFKQIPRRQSRIRSQRTRVLRPAEWPGSEVRALVEQGPAENRINLTIVGDGYTSGEKAKFFADAERITNDLFSETTFHSYLPLFNVYAVFVPSAQSGITDVTRKNTALGLYREPKGSKRGIMPGDFLAAERAISLAPAEADYPILLANDDFYGGLGGRYAITTRSETSGSMVLRHELGHNFGEVGEEYDGGHVYQGANSSRNQSPPWSIWARGGLPHPVTQYLGGAYVWEPLTRPYKVQFDFPNSSRRGDWKLAVDISSVGWASSDDVNVLLDGKRVAIKGVFTKDRSFFTIEMLESFAPGRHELEFQASSGGSDKILAFARIYALESGYDTESGRIGIYDTFNANGDHVGYRPTHKHCLMRDMRSKNFCAPDRENMWHEFLSRVKLAGPVEVESLPSGVKRVTADVPNLNGISPIWYKLGSGGQKTELSAHRGKRVIEFPAGTTGKYSVSASFRTPEVRKYNSDFASEREFSLE